MRAALRGKRLHGAESVAYLVGARPNYVKMAPLVAEMRRRGDELQHVVINTGQHYDQEMSRIFAEELDLGPPDYELRVGSGSHALQTARALQRIEGVLAELRPLALVVPGDVNSTLAGALAAAKLEVPIAHVEAGLRSFDRTMPEEINRVLTDQLSDWCFTHSPEAAENLAREGIDETRVFPVGNTMIDTLVRMRPQIERSTIVERIDLVEDSFLLVTLHRPSLVDGPSFSEVIDGLEELAEWVPVVFPVHPRTRRGISGARRSRRLRLIDPIGYVDFLALELRARAVLTDSGGVQEETTYLGVPCFTMRNNTERPVTITEGTNCLIGTDPAALREIASLLESRSREGRAIEGWDGRAAERAATVLLGSLRGRDDIASESAASRTGTRR
jgi:UDP-N-acetylglucosamine 2-epimerase (non-hydrolysing)